MPRQLASIQRIADIQPIAGADLIALAKVKGWQVVVKKNEYQAGDLTIYCEIDSLLPVREEFEFLRKSSYKSYDNVEGFRLRTIKLRGQLSQGLLLPLSTLQGKMDADALNGLQEGDDVTDILGVVKYEPPISAALSGIIKGEFPGFIPKTDEERVQNLSAQYEGLKEQRFYVTEKLDGASVTYYYRDGGFGVCSRNLELVESHSNSLWLAAYALGLPEKIGSFGNIALQGELVGEKVQGNPYRIQGQKVYFFNAFHIDTQRYFTYDELTALCRELRLLTVPVISDDFALPDTIDAMLLYAEGKSMVHGSADREGVVVRSHDKKVSFKAISNSFLLKHEN